jgi:hypothetical protein
MFFSNSQNNLIDYDSDEYPERDDLLYKKDPKQKISILRVIKDSIGKDLTKITVPVEFNEPLSMLQKISEIMEYEEYLIKANNEQDPQKRFLYIIAFSVA